MLCKRQKIVHLYCLQLCILLTYQIFVFAHISRIEEEYHITAKDQTKNGFICLKDFLLSNHLSMEENEKKETYVAPMSKKFTSVSMSLKLSTADWLPKNRTTSPAKVEKKGQQNEDPLRQTTINSCDARRPLIAIISQKRAKKKPFWLAYRANIRSDAPTTKKQPPLMKKLRVTLID